MSPGASGSEGDRREAAPAPGESAHGNENTRFRTTLIRVLAVQVATLILLWLIQAAYHG